MTKSLGTTVDLAVYGLWIRRINNVNHYLMSALKLFVLLIFGSISLVFTTPAIAAANTCPTIEMIAPVSHVTVSWGETVTIRWDGMDPDDAALVDLFADTDANPDNGTSFDIDTGRSENGTYSWNTTSGTPGTYYIGGVISDGECTGYHYAPGKVTITADIFSNTCPTIWVYAPLSNVTAMQGETVSISWNGTDPDDGALVSLFADTDTDHDNGTFLDIAVGLPMDGSYDWDTAGMAPGAYYIRGVISDTFCDGYDRAFGLVTITADASSCPSVPSLYSPGGMTTDSTPLFSWDMALGADQYRIQVQDTATGLDVVYADVQTDSYQIVSAMASSEYQWRVASLKSGCGDAWSEWRYFTIDDGTTDAGFDYMAYLAANPDLPSDWGVEECMNHYKLYGFWEKRAACFNLEEYLNANPDVPATWTHEEALNHYNMYGKNEDRLLAFDALEYLSLYPDLPQDWSYDQAFSHYMTFGNQEGRIASFDEQAYLELYSDLPTSWGQEETFYHYNYFGRYEDRVYDPYDESVFTSNDDQNDDSNGGIEEQKILPSDDASYDAFGTSVSISGDVAIIGSPEDDGDSTNSGAAHVFQRFDGHWFEVEKLTVSDGASDDHFGFSVSVSGDYAIIGAAYDDDNGADSGSAYIFQRSGGDWFKVAKVTASDGAGDDVFGYSVSISGYYAIVGARYDDDKGAGSGAAYIFHRSGNGWDWVEVEKLTASDGSGGDGFGAGVSISGDYAIVGAECDDDNGADSGAAYIFQRSGSNWVEVEKLIAFDGTNNDYFGHSVSISGDYAVVGSNSDAAYIFRRSGSSWADVEKLTASDKSGSFDQFGGAVSISGDHVIVGAIYDDVNAPTSGSAYIFQRSGENWVELAKLAASDGSADDHFGCSVSISGDYAIIGANYDDVDAPNSGSAYIFQWSGYDGVSGPD